MARNVVLVGFSGAGKTTVGRELARRTGLGFVDLDDAIEEKYHATIPHIFQKYGESVFRQCEYQTLLEKLASPGLLIATGGGTPAYRDAMRRINRSAYSIYICLSEATLVGRLRDSRRPRPLTRNLPESELRDYVRRTLKARTSFYEMADLIVSEESLSMDELAQTVLKNIS